MYMYLYIYMETPAPAAAFSLRKKGSSQGCVLTLAPDAGEGVCVQNYRRFTIQRGHEYTRTGN